MMRAGAEQLQLRSGPAEALLAGETVCATAARAERADAQIAQGRVALRGGGVTQRAQSSSFSRWASATTFWATLAGTMS